MAITPLDETKTDSGTDLFDPAHFHEMVLRINELITAITTTDNVGWSFGDDGDMSIVHSGTKNIINLKGHDLEIQEDGVSQFIFDGETGRLSMKDFAVTTSDREMKKNIKAIDPVWARNTLMAIEAVSYDRIDNGVKGQFGVIAQQIKEFFPAAVIKGDNGYYTVSYHFLYMLALVVTQSQETRIERLEEAVYGTS